MKSVLISRAGYDVNACDNVVSPRFRVQAAVLMKDDYRFPIAAPAYFVLRETPHDAAQISALYARVAQQKLDVVALRHVALMVTQISMHYLALVQDDTDQNDVAKNHALKSVAQNMQDIFVATDKKFEPGFTDHVWQETRSVYEQWQLEKAMAVLHPQEMAKHRKDYWGL